MSCRVERFGVLSSDGSTTLAAYAFMPETPRAIVQISHGMCEYLLRYRDFAEYLAAQGFLVFGHDHLGHGETAKTEADLGFTVSGGGAEQLAEDVYLLSERMTHEHPELPLILFGHSMGSFIARRVLEKHGEKYTAAIFCGTGGPETPASAGRLLASMMMLFCGERYRSRLLKSIAFAGYNKKIEKGCDKNAWLTRDASVVERYNADRFCSYTFTLRAYHDLFTLVEQVSRKAWAAELPRTLPVLVTGGEEDPVGAWGKGMRSVYQRLCDAGMTDVTLRLYPEMRHEILNEVGKEAVWEEICQWILSKLK